MSFVEFSTLAPFTPPRMRFVFLSSVVYRGLPSDPSLALVSVKVSLLALSGDTRFLPAPLPLANGYSQLHRSGLSPYRCVPCPAH